jgi:hypothetical protein
MKRLASITLIACAPLAACSQAKSGLASGDGHGRYVGVGHFAPGPMWSQVADAAAAQGQAARPDDDEQIIVVMDSVTGEVRQCGNLSGRCLSLKPWSGAAPALPATLLKHAAELEAAPAAAAPAPH